MVVAAAKFLEQVSGRFIFGSWSEPDFQMIDTVLLRLGD
jgi:hypothetical protein